MEKNGQTRRATLIKDGERLNVDVRNDEQGIHIQILGEYNDPRVVERLESQILSPDTTIQLQDRVSYSSIKAEIGFLKSAYLAAFAKLGYAYILRHELDVVRQQIRSPQSRLLEMFRLHACSGDEVEKALLLFWKPVHCLGVKIGKSIVCLPPPFDSAAFYERLQEKLKEIRTGSREETWQVAGSIDWPERLELALDFSGRYKITISSG